MSNKKLLSILALLVILLAGGVGLALKLKNKSQSTSDLNPITTENQVESYDLANNLEMQAQYEKIGPPSKITAMPCANYDKRPFAIMFTGDLKSRKYFSNLSLADFVLEMPHRPMHGQPRLMGIYQCNTPEIVGPMRSGRTDHISVAGSLDAIYVPWGGSSVGKSLLAQGVIDHIDCNGEVYPGGGDACFRRNDPKSEELSTLESASSSIPKLIKRAEEVGYRKETILKGYPHQDDLPLAQRPQGGTVRINFEEPNQVYYEYNRDKNAYLRFIKNREDVDFETGQQYAPKNLIVIPVEKQAWSTSVDYTAMGLKDPWIGIDPEHRINDDGQYPNMQLGDPWFDTTFQGPARFYLNGKEIVGSWKREKGLANQFDFFDSSNQPIKFVPGQIWMHVIENERTVEFQPVQ